jgi:hypothetical protein
MVPTMIIRKVRRTSDWYEVWATHGNKLEYVMVRGNGRRLHEMQLGDDKTEVIEPFRELTEAEYVMVGALPVAAEKMDY